MWRTSDGRYDIDDVELGHGAGAQVFRARRRGSGEVAIKIARQEQPDALRRLRREIDVQELYAGPHIMPVLDAANTDQPEWYTMPLAVGNLETMRHELDEGDLPAVLREIVSGLREPHAHGEVHRDLKPANILAIPDGSAQHGRRWVVGDWGFVRRGPDVDTLTITQLGGGTYGYIAPECQTDAHGASPAADIYSLGRLTAWYLTGRTPQQGLALMPGEAQGRWRSLVRQSTETELSDRCPDLDGFLLLLDHVDSSDAARFDLRISELVDQLVQTSTDDTALRTLAGLALDHPEYDVYVDDLARLPSQAIAHWGRVDARSLATVAKNMGRIFGTGEFGHRPFDQANRPLRFLRESVGALLQARKTGDAEDILDAFFPLAVAWDRFAEQSETNRWLSNVSESHADLVARAIRRTTDADRRYEVNRGAPRAIRAVLGR